MLVIRGHTREELPGNRGVEDGNSCQGGHSILRAVGIL
jgi:hypothetical protein